MTTAPAWRRYDDIVVAGVLCVVLLLLYAPAFGVLPSADDWTPPMGDIVRGSHDGLASLFTSSPLPLYRPLQSVAMWAVGHINLANPYPWIRWLHLACAAALALATALWGARIGLDTRTRAIAAAVVLIHPAMGGPIAAIDGFARVAAAAVVWTGALIVIRRFDHLALAVLVAVITLLLGLGFAEYALGLFPILLVGLWPARLNDVRRWRALVVLFAAMVAAFALYYVARTHAVPPTLDAKRLALNPRTWVTNVGLLVSALLFPGNTVWVITQRTPLAYAAFVTGAAAVAGFVGFGWYLESRRAPPTTTAPRSLFPTNRLPWLLLASTFPMVILGKISEMYLAQLMVPFALIFARAADGWLAGRWRPVGVTGLGLIVVTAVVAVRSKIGDLVDVGQRAHVLGDAMLGHVPDHADGCRYAIVFDHRLAQPLYSVFALSDQYLIQPDHGHFFMDYHRPGQAIVLDTILDDDPRATGAVRYDGVFDWDAATHRLSARANTTTERCTRQPAAAVG